MPHADAKERAKTFREVNFGYDLNRAVEEADRCLRCQDPTCQTGCPVNVPIRGVIQLVSQRRFDDALALIKRFNSLPGVCGRVCPQENQCEGRCHVGDRFGPVGIGYIERFLADWERMHGPQPVHRAEPKGQKVAIVGSGPSGLTAAGDLNHMGYEVTVFEALHEPGGVLRYGIPEFRLPKDVLDDEIASLVHAGVDIQCNVVFGKTLTLDQLMDEMGYEAVFIGTGAGLPRFMNLPGENLNGIYSANEFLTRINLMGAYQFPDYDTPVKSGRRVAVIGAGNTAMDAARCAMRAGSEEVTVVYRRSEAEMTARVEEYEHAIEEGVQFKWLNNPIEFIDDGNGWVSGMRCQRMELGEPDEGGRRRPVPVPGSEFVMDVNNVIVSIGTSPNPLLARTTPELATTKWGGLVAEDATGQTSREGVFAGGDIVTGAATVILAAGAGKRAAAAIDTYLSEKRRDPAAAS
jgi:glutamate synthase (NADPH/NADH) small chain